MLAGVFLTFVDTSFISPFYYSAFPVCRRFQSMELQFAAMKGLMRTCLYKVMQAFLLYD
jgi:hypothetical protein